MKVRFAPIHSPARGARHRGALAQSKARRLPRLHENIAWLARSSEWKTGRRRHRAGQQFRTGLFGRIYVFTPQAR